MGKFDPTYDIVLANIPFSYNISSNNLSALYVTGAEATKTYGNVGSNYKGLISEYETIISSSSVIMTSIEAMINSVNSQLTNINTNISNFQSPSLNVISANLYSFMNAFPNISISASSNANSSIQSLYQNAEKSFTNAISEMSSIANSYLASNFLGKIRSAAEQVSVDISNVEDKLDDSIVAFDTFADNLDDALRSFTSGNNLFINAKAKILSVINNIKPNMDYTDFLVNSVPQVAFNTAESISNYYISNLDIARRNFLMGYDKFAGKRIGLTNYIDLYTTKETLKTIKDLKVDVYDKIFNAINAYYVKYVETQLDLTKFFANYVLEIDKFQIDALKLETQIYGEIPKLYAELAGIMAQSQYQKYGYAFGYASDVIKSAVAVYESSIRGSNSAFDTAVRYNSGILDFYSDLIKTELQRLVNNTTINNDMVTRKIGSYGELINGYSQYINEFVKNKLFRFDKTLEFTSMFVGIPNTVNRGMSQFERTAATTSLIANTLATVGNMALPFL